MNFDEEIKAIINYIRDFSKEIGKKIAVITAGGIDTKEKFKHQFELGADGVQISTNL
jgi:NAD(P)H-dependent flavin oxidoreductase YrpB (nitropropane dioxygenase family)